MLEALRWFVDSDAGAAAGLPVCRVKNKFARGAAAADGYRDLSLSVVVTAAAADHGGGGAGELRVIGEVQLHDRAMHALKLQVGEQREGERREGGRGRGREKEVCPLRRTRERERETLRERERERKMTIILQCTA